MKKKLKTFESAAKSIGIDPSLLPDVSLIPTMHQKAVIAFYMLSIISQAAWAIDGNVIDWNNWDQRKFYLWFDLSDEKNSVGSSSGFSLSVYFFVYSYSVVGSRLVFPNEEIATYVGETHINLYRDLMVLDK